MVAVIINLLAIGKYLPPDTRNDILNKILLIHTNTFQFQKETPNHYTTYYTTVNQKKKKKRYLPRSKCLLLSPLFPYSLHGRLSMNPYQRHGISVFIGNAIWPPQTVSCRLWRGYACETQGGVGKKVIRQGWSVIGLDGWRRFLRFRVSRERGGKLSRPLGPRSVGNPWLSWSNCGLRR